jgi:hypothetical protein
MKHNITSKRAILFTTTLAFILLVKAQAGDMYGVKPEDIVESTHTDDIYVFENVADNFKNQRDQLSSNLLKVFQDKNLSNLNRCAAAYYLGEMRSSETADALASDIALQFDKSQIKIKYLIKINIPAYPAMNALIKIGSPSIPAMIRNLTENDDVPIRNLSLKVLCRIDGDKDIVQLRLQKALAAEKDSQKQARLQMALKMLSEASFGT